MPLAWLEAESPAAKGCALLVVAQVAGIRFSVFAASVLAAETFFLLVARGVDVQLAIALPPPHHAHAEAIGGIRTTAASSSVAPSPREPWQFSSLHAFKIGVELDIVLEGSPLGGERIVFRQRVALYERAEQE